MGYLIFFGIASISIAGIIIYEKWVTKRNRYLSLLEDKRCLENAIKEKKDAEREAAKKKEEEEKKAAEEKKEKDKKSEKLRSLLIEGNILVCEDSVSNIKEIIEILSVNEYTVHAVRYSKRLDNKYHKSVDVYYSYANCIRGDWRGITEKELSELIFY